LVGGEFCCADQFIIGDDIMPLNEFSFILFLTVTFVAAWHFCFSQKGEINILVLASIGFYAYWNRSMIFLLLFSIGLDYVCGKKIFESRQGSWHRKAYFVFSVVANLGMLGFFKYSNFAISNVNWLAGMFGSSLQYDLLNIVLPVGISFYTFQSMSYTIDIYRNKIEPAASLKDFAHFIMFFPQLVAGPIVRASEFMPQLMKEKKLSIEQWGSGIYLILKGLTKKCLLADYLGFAIVDQVFANYTAYSSLECWIALTAFHFQVYCDFSGYSDIAIGTARLFGYELPENFRQPYLSRSPAEFWRRWHMTLGRFVSDYLYKPLGGSQASLVRGSINTMICFSVIGFWHGANWNYVLFGVYHGLGVVGARLANHLRSRLGFQNWGDSNNRALIAFQIIMTNLFVIGSLALFRTSSLGEAAAIYKVLFSWDGTVTIHLSLAGMGVLLLAIISHVVSASIKDRLGALFIRTPAFTQGLCIAAVIILMRMMGTFAESEFIYYQF
jgi:D-alanyl-lipoteichoic acid acyltransferase DltB (MBOAT superfamily)